VEDCYVAVMCCHLKRPSITDDHWTVVGHCQVASCLEAVQYAAKVDRQRLILKREVREEDGTANQQLILPSSYESHVTAPTILSKIYKRKTKN